MGYRWTWFLIVWSLFIPQLSAIEPILDLEETIEEATVCSDMPAMDCKRVSCIELCLQDPHTEPTECPLYCNLQASKRRPTSLAAY
jgi:hypothetical protein